MLASLLGVALAGCVTAPLAPDPAVDPRGEWTIAAVNGAPTGGSERFVFVIAPPTGSARFGCNAGNGSLTVGNGWVVAGDWIITVAGCPGRMQFERRGFAITAKPMVVERRDVGIRLRNQRGTIDLTPLPPAPSLEGEWRVLAVNGRPTAGTVRFEQPLFRTNFGCNEGRSGYRIEQSALIPVGPMATTERGCVTATGEPTEAVKHEDEGFRIAFRRMRVTFYGPNRVRLSNEAGTIDLGR